MDSRRPKVSIGIPVFNGAQFIGKALDSLLAQTFGDFEIVISDNASTDATESICREYAERDQRIRYQRLPENLGANHNFNRLVGISRGEYFKWAAIDDLCLPGYLAPLVTILDQNPEVIWCHSQSAKIDAAGRILSSTDPEADGLAHTTDANLPRTAHDSDDVYQRYLGVLLGSSWCADCYGLIRRSALDQTQLYPSCYGSEKVLIGELALLGKYHEIGETLFLQRVHIGSSASIVSRSGQRRYANGIQSSRWFGSMRWSLVRSHLSVVYRAKLTTWDRWRCYGALIHYVLQFRKWWHVCRSTLLGKPIKEYPVAHRQTQTNLRHSALTHQTGPKL